MVRNVAPVIEPFRSSLAPVLPQTELDVTAGFTDPGSDTFLAVWNWGDGSETAGNVTTNGSRGSVTGTHSYDEAGLYPVTLTVNDGESSVESADRYAAVFDPDAGGLVRNSGWFNSPPGALADHRRVGRVTFSLDCRYAAGATTPVGVARIAMSTARFSFASAGFDWMVVQGSTVFCQGVGSVNGRPGYRFLVAATDGPGRRGAGGDRIRVRIWNAANGSIVYDTQRGAQLDAQPVTPLGEGSITITR
jgi:hypothetical protein